MPNYVNVIGYAAIPCFQGHPLLWCISARVSLVSCRIGSGQVGLRPGLVTESPAVQQLLALPPRAPSRPLAACHRFLPPFRPAQQQNRRSVCLPRAIHGRPGVGIYRIYLHFLSTNDPLSASSHFISGPAPTGSALRSRTQHKTRHAQAQLWANTRAADPSPRNTTQPRFPNLGLLLPALCVEVKQPLPGATGIGRHVLRM